MWKMGHSEAFCCVGKENQKPNCFQELRAESRENVVTATKEPEEIVGTVHLPWHGEPLTKELHRNGVNFNVLFNLERSSFWPTVIKAAEPSKIHWSQERTTQNLLEKSFRISSKSTMSLKSLVMRRAGQLSNRFSLVRLLILEKCWKAVFF